MAAAVLRCDYSSKIWNGLLDKIKYNMNINLTCFFHLLSDHHRPASQPAGAWIKCQWVALELRLSFSFAGLVFKQNIMWLEHMNLRIRIYFTLSP
jgi:hypothetical protein